MFNYLHGKITDRTPLDITIDIHGVGYQVITANPYDFKLDETLKVYVYNHVREDINILYGFKTTEEKTLFLKLISVKGIGPKSALAILATGNVFDVVKAIENSDAKFLNRFPGIGPKASQQIILDLKGKIEFDVLEPSKNESLDEAKEALKSLGYKPKEIDKVLKKVDENESTESIIKQALSLMLK